MNSIGISIPASPSASQNGPTNVSCRPQGPIATAVLMRGSGSASCVSLPASWMPSAPAGETKGICVTASLSPAARRDHRAVAAHRVAEQGGVVRVDQPRQVRGPVGGDPRHLVEHEELVERPVHQRRGEGGLGAVGGIGVVDGGDDVALGRDVLGQVGHQETGCRGSRGSSPGGGRDRRTAPARRPARRGPGARPRSRRRE